MYASLALPTPNRIIRFPFPRGLRFLHGGANGFDASGVKAGTASTVLRAPTEKPLLPNSKHENDVMKNFFLSRTGVEMT